MNGPAAHSGACPACELLGGDRAAPNDAGDLGERHVEHVVQHERDPLSRREAIQHDEQRQSHRVRGECFVFRVDTAAWVRDCRDVCRVQRFLLARGAGPQYVQADAGGHGRQPAAQVLHLPGLGAAQP